MQTRVILILDKKVPFDCKIPTKLAVIGNKFKIKPVKSEKYRDAEVYSVYSLDIPSYTMKDIKC